MCDLMICICCLEIRHLFHSILVNIPELNCGVPHVSTVCHKLDVMLYFGFDSWSYM